MGGQADWVVDERSQFGSRGAPAVGALVPPYPELPAVSENPLAPRASTAQALAGRLARFRYGTGRSLARSVSGSIADDVDRGLWFLLLPVFMAGGAAAWFVASLHPSPWAIGCGFLLALTLFRLSAGRPVWRHAALAAMLVLAGMASAAFEAWRASTEITGSAVTTRVTGHVVRIEHRADGRVRLTMDLIATERPTLRYAPARVRATAAHVPEGTQPGSVVQGVVRLLPPSGPVRPGGYDFAFESYFDRIGAIGFFLGEPTLLSDPPPPGNAARVAALVEQARLALAERVRGRIDGAEGEIAAALIAGVRAGIPEEINEALRRTGLAHVLSISGLHMALVAATVMVSMRALFALFPGFSSRRPVKKHAAAIALVACALYLAVSGAAVAAQRSFLMLAVMLVALLFDRAALTMRNLAIAALVVLAVSPHEVMGPSFQMSFAATAALIGGYAAWSEWRARRPPRPMVQRGPIGLLVGKAVYFLAGLAMTSVVAGLATTIYGVYHFHRVSPYALGANMVAMPIVSAVVMPAGVLAVVLMPFGLEGWALDLMGRGIAAMNAIAIWFSDRTPLDAVGLMPVSALLLLTLALVIATLSTTALRLAALPLAVVGMAYATGRDLPDVLVSEDGRLVAVRLDDGRLAVNRARPNTFVFDNWMMVMAAPDWLKPRAASPEAGRPGDASGGFACEADTCVMTTSAGARIVHAPDAAAARAHCVAAALIVVADPTANKICLGPHQATVVTRRDLARHGSAAVSIERSSNGTPRATVAHAIAESFRPWHAHRQFSREARGLAPRERHQPADRQAGVSSDGSGQPAAPEP